MKLNKKTPGPGQCWFETMTSVYFPSHVFLLVRRLVNVVSTLSISKHCISHHGPYVQTHKQGEHIGPWLLIRQTWDSALLGTMSGVKEMGNTLYLCNLILFF